MRLTGAEFACPVVITNSDFRFIVTEQLQAIGIDPGAILIEPEGRNTAPAVLAAALYLAKSDPEAVMLVAPSDHVVPDTAAFQAAVATGLNAVGLTAGGPSPPLAAGQRNSLVFRYTGPEGLFG